MITEFYSGEVSIIIFLANSNECTHGTGRKVLMAVLGPSVKLDTILFGMLQVVVAASGPEEPVGVILAPLAM